MSAQDLSNYVKIEPAVIAFSRTAGRLAIPGGTIKGNIRSRLELSFKAKGGVVRACFIRAGPAIEKLELPGRLGWRHQRIWVPAVYEERGPPCNLTSDNVVCLLCDLFGTAGLKSLIDFSDFVLDEGDVGNLEIVELPYNMRLEAVKPDSRFHGSLHFKNLKPEELGLLLFGMAIRRGSLSEPALLGRLKYNKSVDGRKFGRIRYKVEELRLSRYSAPLRYGGAEVRPGETLQGIGLDELLGQLVQEALNKFTGELTLINEVGAVEQLGQLR
ncbi:MAG: RAMP superfamily CRISPR-associated protein [Aigarchaeota archaeon]|nr:RAMP superfamily CRISPR-associated protein [Aigarchaeota archaeon]